MSSSDLDYYQRRWGRYAEDDYDRDFGYRGYPEASWGRFYETAFYGGPYRSWGAGYGPPHADGRGLAPEQAYQQRYEESDPRERQALRESHRQHNHGRWISGLFAGKGPRNYRRSDDRVREDINEVLTAHPQIDPSDIEVLVSNGEVTLEGAVDTRDDKRLAENIAWDVSGVKEVYNRLAVAHRQQPSWSSRRRVA